MSSPGENCRDRVVMGGERGRSGVDLSFLGMNGA